MVSMELFHNNSLNNIDLMTEYFTWQNPNHNGLGGVRSSLLVGTLYKVQCTKYSVPGTVYQIQCTRYSVPVRVYQVQGFGII